MILCHEYPDGSFRVRPVTWESRELVTKPGQYRLKRNKSSKSQSKCGSSYNQTFGMAGRMYRQRVDLKEYKKNRQNVGIMLAELIGSAGVYSTLPESRKKAAQYPLLEEIAKTLAQEAPAFKCNEDKVDGMIGEAVNFLFEFSYMSSMSASFGYALEKVFNCGDIGIRWMCRILLAPNTPSPNAGAVSELSGVTDIHLFGTWPHENDAMHNHIEQHLHPVKDIPTLQAIKSMIRDRHPLGFLKLYEMHSLFDKHRGLKPIVDAISTSDGFEAVKRAVVDIRAAMTSTTDPTEKSRRVKAAIATIDKKSKFGKRYLAPKKYHKECAESLTSLKAS